MARLPLPTRLVRENLAIYFNSSVLRHSIISTRREAFLVGPTRAAGYSTKPLYYHLRILLARFVALLPALIAYTIPLLRWPVVLLAAVAL